MNKLVKPHRLPRSCEMSIEGRARNPLTWKGTRTRFRTLFRKSIVVPAGLRYRTDIERNPIRLVVIITKGSVEVEQQLRALLDGKFFEGLPITVVRRDR